MRLQQRLNNKKILKTVPSLPGKELKNKVKYKIVKYCMSLTWPLASAEQFSATQEEKQSRTLIRIRARNRSPKGSIYIMWGYTG